MLWLCGNMSVERMLIRKSRVVCCVVISWLADDDRIFETCRSILNNLFVFNLFLMC